MTVIGALCVIPYFMLHGNAVTVAAYEAGIGTVPLLMVYVLISVVTAAYIWRHDRASFRVTAHVLPALAGAGRWRPSVSDLILACDTIRTLDPRRPSATAVAIDGGVIAAVGDRRDIPAWRGRRTEVIDLGRATLTPGLTDSHLHPVLGLDM